MNIAKVEAEKIQLRKIVPVREYLDNNFDLTDKKIELGVAQLTKHNLDKKSFKISILVSFSSTEKIFGEYLYDFIFEVENILDFLAESDGKKAFTGQLLGTLIGLSYSTLRGILFYRLAETKLSGFIIPVVNPNNILKSKISD